MCYAHISAWRFGHASCAAGGRIELQSPPFPLQHEEASDVDEGSDFEAEVMPKKTSGAKRGRKAVAVSWHRGRASLERVAEQTQHAARLCGR